MGKRTFYHFGFRSNKWFKTHRNNSSAIYQGNQYAWNDTTVHDGSKCAPVEPVNLLHFCTIMEKLDMQRLFFVGDSLANSQLVSLLSLLGYNAADFIPQSRKAVVTRTEITCPNYPPITVRLARENLGPNLRLTNITGREDVSVKVEFGAEMPYCGEKNEAVRTKEDLCPWMEEYNATKMQQKTLLILNQGAHFHSLDSFSHSFDLFLNTFGKIARKDDIVVFRDTVPGHFDCFDNDKNVFAVTDLTHDKFLTRYGTTRYDWNLFAAYNAYAKEHLPLLDGAVARSMYLNVYNMTTLRPDQHVAAKDCLHYTFPGPIDFWNHLLFTNLAALSNIF